jgi:hypothetical protein
MKWTIEKTWNNSRVIDSSFISDAESFISRSQRGLSYVKKQIVPHLGGGECTVNSEVMFQNNSRIKDFENKKVLVIGAGPSLNTFDFSLVKNYDKIVTCNHFFMNNKVAQLPISMVFLGDEVKYGNKNLNNHLQKSNYLIGFENIGRSANDLVSFKKDYGDRVFWAHTRYHSKIGAVVRIVSFLCSLQPKKIAVIGMDGFKKSEISKSQNKHAFEPHKTPNGSYENNFKGEIIEQKYKQQYLEFWDYVLHDIGKDISFENLGHRHPCNLTTEILSDKIGKDYQNYLLKPLERK